jgi:signal recognition particle subunit SRP54
LIETLGSTATDVKLDARPHPFRILMLGLQGSGKTTTSAKLAKRLTEKDRKKVLLASLDTRRPAAQEQLARARHADPVWRRFAIVAGQTPVAIAKRAIEAGRTEGYDVVILDTAGRLSIDEELMAEAKAVRHACRRAEIAAGRRRHDRPGRGDRRRRASTRGSASPASVLTRARRRCRAAAPRCRCVPSPASRSS